jgi:hypothetical protein
MSAREEGPPSPALPGQGGGEPTTPITTPAKVPLAGRSLRTLLLEESDTNRAPQASVARPRMGVLKRSPAPPPVAREAPLGGVEEPGTPVPPRVKIMPVDRFTTLTRAHSPMYRELFPSGDRARAVGPDRAKVARVAGPPSPVEVGVQAPHRPASTPAIRAPPAPS